MPFTASSGSSSAKVQLHLRQGTDLVNLLRLNEWGGQLGTKFSSYLWINSPETFDIIATSNTNTEYGIVTRHRVPRHLCIPYEYRDTNNDKDNDDVVLYLKSSAILAWFDEVSSMNLVIEDSTHRAGVSVNLSTKIYTTPISISSQIENIIKEDTKTYVFQHHQNDVYHRQDKDKVLYHQDSKKEENTLSFFLNEKNQSKKTTSNMNHISNRRYDPHPTSGDIVYIVSKCTKIGKNLGFTKMYLIFKNKIVAEGNHIKFIHMGSLWNFLMKPSVFPLFYTYIDSRVQRKVSIENKKKERKSRYQDQQTASNPDNGKNKNKNDGNAYDNDSASNAFNYDNDDDDCIEGRDKFIFLQQQQEQKQDLSHLLQHLESRQNTNKDELLDSGYMVHQSLYQYHMTKKVCNPLKNLHGGAVAMLGEKAARLEIMRLITEKYENHVTLTNMTSKDSSMLKPQSSGPSSLKLKDHMSLSFLQLFWTIDCFPNIEQINIRRRKLDLSSPLSYQYGEQSVRNGLIQYIKPISITCQYPSATSIQNPELIILVESQIESKCYQLDPQLNFFLNNDKNFNKNAKESTMKFMTYHDVSTFVSFRQKTKKPIADTRVSTSAEIHWKVGIEIELQITLKKSIDQLSTNSRKQNIKFDYFPSSPSSPPSSNYELNNTMIYPEIYHYLGFQSASSSKAKNKIQMSKL